VSAAATAALERLSGAATGAPPDLLALVEAPDAAPRDVRRQKALKIAGLLGALLAGGGLGALAMVAAPAHLKPEHEGPEVRRLAIRALQVMGCGDAAVYAALLRALRYDGAVAVRAAAAEALGAVGQSGGPLVAAGLCHALRDEHVAVRAAAASALGALCAAQAAGMEDDTPGAAATVQRWVVSALVGLVREPAAGMAPARGAAVESLGRLAGRVEVGPEEEAARGVLRLACAAREAEVRAAAVVALAAWAAHGPVGDEEPTLLSRLADGNGLVRMAAVDAVASCGQPSPEGSAALLTAALDRGYPQAALRARRLLETWCAQRAGQAEGSAVQFDRLFGWACRRCVHDTEEGSDACAGCYEEAWPVSFAPGTSQVLSHRR
jgi:HEAT repeat protein